VTPLLSPPTGKTTGRGEKARRPRRIGIYGGTFNPVHLAHLLLAEEIRERFRLDRVLFIPSGEPPHKGGRFPEGQQRLEMVRIAIEGNGNFRALDLEVRRQGPSYTIETLRALHRRHGGRARFFFLIGMDALQEIETWHEAESLAGLTSFISFPRPGYPLEHPSGYLPASWKAGRPVATAKGISRFPLTGRTSLFLVETFTVPVSATDIRERVRRGRSIRYLVPAGVERYIRKHGLYTPSHKGG
jgi:nicotinate-nucleotide adenylyltransferase